MGGMGTVAWPGSHLWLTYLKFPGTIRFFVLLFCQNRVSKNQVYVFYTNLRLVKFHNTVKLGIKELLNKEHIGFKELFTDYQLFYSINLCTVK